MNRSICLLVSLLLYCAGLVAQKFYANEGGPFQTRYHETIPYAVKKEKIILSADLQGQKASFILDSGSPTVVAQSLLNHLGISPAGYIEVSDVNNQKDSMAYCKLPSLRLGALTFFNIPAIVLPDEHPILQCFGVAGFIGSNLLRNSVVRFDDRRRTIVLSSPADFTPAPSAVASPVQLDGQSGVYLSVSMEKTDQFVLFDSGSPDFYSIGQKEWEKLQQQEGVYSTISKGFGATTMGLHGMESPAEKTRLALRELKIAGRAFRGVVTETDSDDDSRVGYGLLSYGALTIDYPGRRSFFEPYADTVYTPDKYWNISPVFLGDGMYVGAIWESARSLPLRIGDRILQINGRDVDTEDFCYWLVESPLTGVNEAVLKVIDLSNAIKEVVMRRE